MDLCTNLQKKVLDLEKAKTAQDSEIANLKKKVKKLERRNKSRTHVLKRLRKVGRTTRIESSEDERLGDQEDASKQGRKIADIDADTEVSLVDETQGRNDEEMFDTGVLDGEKVFAGLDMAKKEVSAADPVTTAGEVVTTTNVKIPDELTLAQTLIEIKSAKPKAVTTTATAVTSASTRPRAKGIIFQDKEEQIKKKDQVLFDKQEALRLQAQFDEEDRIAREKEEVNAALTAQ
ncbi:hypothetical protein Tco_0564492 [Tanacetum coccineum]